MRRINYLIKAKLGFLGLLILLGLTPAFAVKLPNVTIPATGYKDSLPFTVSDTGKIEVRVKLRVNTLFGVPLLGESQFKAELRKVGVGHPVVDTATRNVTSTFETVTLSYDVTDCGKTGSYFVRLSNSGDINKQQGEAEFPEFFPPVLVPTNGTLSEFGVTQGNEIFIDIPNNLEPTGSGGTLKVTAGWLSFCLLDQFGCMLTFQLVKMDENGNPKNIGLQSTGYSGSLSPRMELNVTFTDRSQTDGNFKLKIKGDSRGNVQNVKTIVKYTPKCGG